MFFKKQEVKWILLIIQEVLVVIDYVKQSSAIVGKGEKKIMALHCNHQSSNGPVNSRPQFTNNPSPPFSHQNTTSSPSFSHGANQSSSASFSSSFIFSIAFPIYTSLLPRLLHFQILCLHHLHFLVLHLLLHLLTGERE